METGTKRTHTAQAVAWRRKVMVAPGTRNEDAIASMSPHHVKPVSMLTQIADAKKSGTQVDALSIRAIIYTMERLI